MGLFRILITEPVVVGAIVLSTIAMFGLGFVEEGSAAAQAWLIVDIACVIFFAIEATLKIWFSGWRLYWADRWNRFDFTISVLCLPVLAIPFVDAHLFIGFPVLRLARLFRLFRLLRFIPERDRLAAGVVRALKASIGVFLAIGLVNFIFAMGAHILFAQKAPQYFANPAKACYSMFQIFTIEGWYEIPDAIAAGASDSWAVLARVYFGAAVLIGGILGLSLGNAVFVDQMVADNTHSLEDRVDALSDEIHLLHNEILALRSLLRERAVPAPEGGGSTPAEP